MKPIVGLDTGSRRIAAYELDTGLFQHIEVEPSTPDREIQELMAWLTQVAWLSDDDDVWLETTVVGAGVQSALRHSMTVGAILATVGGTLISPTTWKASVLGHGSADVHAYSRWVEDSDPEVAETIRGITTRKQQRQDCYAAFCIAQYGHLARRYPDQLGKGRRVSKRRHRP